MGKTRFVGGPLDGQWLAANASLVVLHGERWAYHRTHVPAVSPDPDWWIKGRPEPTSEIVYEWHERSWRSPAERAIRSAVGD